MRDKLIWLTMLGLGLALGAAVMGLVLHKPPERNYQEINHTVEFDGLVYFDSGVFLCNSQGCYNLWDMLEERVPDRNFVEVW